MINLLEYFDFSIQDCIEIFFFSAICYYFSLWLIKDRQKNLIVYFYGYCLVAFSAYYYNLSTIAFFLFTGFPIAIMLFIILHQDILQRNFVALHNISSKNIVSTRPNLWHEILIRSCLVLLHKQKSIMYVIEQHHSLKNFIETSFIFDTPLQDGLVHISTLPRDMQKNLEQNFPVNSAIYVKVLDYDLVTGRIRLKLINK